MLSNSFQVVLMEEALHARWCKQAFFSSFPAIFPTNRWFLAQSGSVCSLPKHFLPFVKNRKKYTHVTRTCKRICAQTPRCQINHVKCRCRESNKVVMCKMCLPPPPPNSLKICSVLNNTEQSDTDETKRFFFLPHTGC